MSAEDQGNRLVAVTLDAGTIGRAAPDIEHERAVAIYDLLEENRFALKEQRGPYKLTLSLVDRRLVLDIRMHNDEPASHTLCR